MHEKKAMGRCRKKAIEQGRKKYLSQQLRAPRAVERIKVRTPRAVERVPFETPVITVERGTFFPAPLSTTPGAPSRRERCRGRGAAPSREAPEKKCLKKVALSTTQGAPSRRERCRKKSTSLNSRPRIFHFFKLRASA